MPHTAHCTLPQMVAEHIRPEQMPDPWFLDTAALLAELARIRDLALRIPATRNELIGPINRVINAVWDLEERLRFCFALHCERQRQYFKEAAEQLSKSQTKPLDRQPAARTRYAR